jgi:hypothetical protein
MSWGKRMRGLRKDAPIQARAGPLQPAGRPSWIATAILGVVALAALPLSAIGGYVLPVTAPASPFVWVQRNAEVIYFTVFLAYPLSAMAVLLMLLIRPRWRSPGLIILIGLVGGFLIMPLATQWAYGKRVRLVLKVPARAQPLISALGRYKRDHGEYPPDLSALVPKYLKRIPPTGLAAYPEFQYTAADDRFSLKVTAAMVLRFDYLLYSSAGDYHAYGPPGRIEQVLRGKYRTDRLYVTRDGWAFYPG